MDSVNIHEMAHTYFGDLVVMRHFEHVWLKGKLRNHGHEHDMLNLRYGCLSESWATYIQALWLEDHSSHEEYRFEIINDGERYIGECASYMRPIVCRVYNSSWEMFDMHTYPGECCVVWLLTFEEAD
jgi:aminopeptidase N